MFSLTKVLFARHSYSEYRIRLKGEKITFLHDGMFSFQCIYITTHDLVAGTGPNISKRYKERFYNKENLPTESPAYAFYFYLLAI